MRLQSGMMGRWPVAQLQTKNAVRLRKQGLEVYSDTGALPLVSLERGFKQHSGQTERPRDGIEDHDIVLFFGGRKNTDHLESWLRRDQPLAHQLHAWQPVVCAPVSKRSDRRGQISKIVLEPAIRERQADGCGFLPVHRSQSHRDQR